MALVMPSLQDGPFFDGMCVEDEVDIFTRVSPSMGTSVISGCQVIQNTGSDMNVLVLPGLVSILGSLYTFTGAVVQIPVASAGDRRDTIVIRAVNAATPYVQAFCIKGVVPSGLVGAWTRNTLPSTALPPIKGPVQWPSATPQTSIDVMTDCVAGEVYVAFNTTAITGTLTSIISPTTGNLVDKTNTLLYIGSQSFEGLVRDNSADQLTPLQGNLPFAGFRGINVGNAILSTDAPNVGQLVGTQMPYVVSGCAWTADSSGASLNCSMTAGTVMIGGILLTVSAVTSRAFTASDDTYIDFTNAGNGTATITYVTVANFTMSPALAGGTVLNTIRCAVISAGSSSVASSGIAQGAVLPATNAGSQPSTTVAAGSNGQGIGSLTGNALDVAASTTFQSGGGMAQIAHSGGQLYTVIYGSTGSGTLTGIPSTNLIQGTAADTVATSDTVKGIWPVGAQDMLGNRIYPTTPYSGIIAGLGGLASITTTLTALSPLNAVTTPGMVVPFIVPPGPNRNIRVTFQTPNFGSSAAAGTTLNARLYSGNGVGTLAIAAPQVKVISDSDALQVSGLGQLVPGTYYAQVWTSQSASGTLTVGTLFLQTNIIVELV
jgi:hypothetical protein